MKYSTGMEISTNFKKFKNFKGEILSPLYNSFNLMNISIKPIGKVTSIKIENNKKKPTKLRVKV